MSGVLLLELVELEEAAVEVGHVAEQLVQVGERAVLAAAQSPRGTGAAGSSGRR